METLNKHDFTTKSQIEYNCETITLINRDTPMSWNSYCRGTNVIEFEMNTVKKWVQIEASEYYWTEKNKLVNREVFITLKENQAKALYETLKKVFETTKEVA